MQSDAGRYVRGTSTCPWNPASARTLAEDLEREGCIRSRTGDRDGRVQVFLFHNLINNSLPQHRELASRDLSPVCLSFHLNYCRYTTRSFLEI